MKLNLGCGSNKIEGYLNVDKVGDPDVKADLEDVPWFFAADDSVDEAVAHHVLEHLGQTTQAFFAIIRELYRVCKDGAVIHLTFPHHRHNNAVDDPSHVRQLTLYGLSLFDQERNRASQAEHKADSTLGLDLGVDFVISNPSYMLEKDVSDRLAAGEITEADIADMERRQNNIIKEVRVDWIVRKGDKANHV